MLFDVMVEEDGDGREALVRVLLVLAALERRSPPAADFGLSRPRGGAKAKGGECRRRASNAAATRAADVERGVAQTIEWLRGVGWIPGGR